MSCIEASLGGLRTHLLGVRMFPSVTGYINASVVQDSGDHRARPQRCRREQVPVVFEWLPSIHTEMQCLESETSALYHEDQAGNN